MKGAVIRSAGADLELEPEADPFAHASVKRLVDRYGSPLLIIDAQRIRLQYRALAAALPNVILHYALKPLPHPAVVRILRDEGASFDLATNGEVALVQRQGVAPGRCIHSHPIKRDCDIRTALAFGVTRFVIDNPDELRKFVKYRNRVSLLIRISFRSPHAVCDLSKKFGCAPEAVASLLDLAAEQRIDVEGLAFHVGSQTAGPSMHVQAIEVCRTLIIAARAAGHTVRRLDIGGGFPADYEQPSMPIEDFCAPIRTALSRYGPDIEIIAEPGRYIAAPSAAAVSTVMGRALRDGSWWYYLDDGLYGSYSGQIYDHARYPVEALKPAGQTFDSVLAGPTCDSIDVVHEGLRLPLLEAGDLILGRSMGAYTWASASEFNFFPKATVIALDQGRRLADPDA